MFNRQNEGGGRGYLVGIAAAKDSPLSEVRRLVGRELFEKSLVGIEMRVIFRAESRSAVSDLLDFDNHARCPISVFDIQVLYSS